MLKRYLITLFLSISFFACAVSNRTDLNLAIARGDVVRVKALIHAGSPVNPPVIGRGAAPLDTAVSWNHLGIVKLLLEAGADVNAAGRDGVFEWNPLHTAVVNGYVEIARYLIQNGANVNKLKDGMTALWMTIRSRRSENAKFELVKRLVGNGADVNGRVQGIDVDLPSGCQKTHLQQAVFMLRFDITEYLLVSGAEGKGQ